MDDKNKIFYAVKNDDGSVGEFKPFEIGEIPTPPPCETAVIENLNVTFTLCKEAAERLAVELKPFIEALHEIYAVIFKEITNNKWVAYLAIHARKKRTRKKNRNRMIKYVLNQIERARKIDKKDSDEGN